MKLSYVQTVCCSLMGAPDTFFITDTTSTTYVSPGVRLGKLVTTGVEALTGKTFMTGGR